MIKNLLILLLAAYSILSATDKPVKKIYGKELFPLSGTTKYIYDSSFGDATTKVALANGLIENKSEADNFKYHQKLEMRESGLFIHETYQYIKLLIFIKKETKVTYNKPFQRYAFPLFVGKEWNDEAIEYINGDSNKVNVTGKVLAEEEMATKAGKFTALKIETTVESATGSKNIVTEWIAAGIGLVKARIEIKGGGLMGFARDILGYGTINFELKEILYK
ncbi:MAG: hypothetical protein FD122_1275 [Stygiobacter sp.]|nr:MAG: hypothetical protein FD122_1275 [Stygiobacter sp.]KAF0218146.1 MAG: hypothetical protein FD178_26 [Ignavibacteria bacterium]